MMINFPVFERLDISGYGLFPGVEDSDPGLRVNFMSGLTLVLGTNGLGKTTLVTIIYRLLTGPFDIPRLAGRTDLGTIRLEPTQLPANSRTIFAQRVVDGARNASARLSFRLGTHTVVIERHLSNLGLMRFEIDNQALPTDGENEFQVEIPKLVSVSSFGDWILLLRYLVFYFEDRRALVWDSSAQRQILRTLFLSLPTARNWTENEREILELDSRMRNLSAILYKEERALVDNEIRARGGADVLNELRTLETLQETDIELRERLEDELLEVETVREQTRLRLLKAEQEREGRYRRVERARLLAIQASFPDRSETARYIFAQLLTNQNCLVCGNHVPAAAADYSARVEQAKCVVCGSDLTGSEVTLVGGVDEANGAIARAAVDLELTETNLRGCSKSPLLSLRATEGAKQSRW